MLRVLWLIETFIAPKHNNELGLIGCFLPFTLLPIICDPNFLLGCHLVWVYLLEGHENYLLRYKQHKQSLVSMRRNYKLTLYNITLIRLTKTMYHFRNQFWTNKLKIKLIGHVASSFVFLHAMPAANLLMTWTVLNLGRRENQCHMKYQIITVGQLILVI